MGRQRWGRVGIRCLIAIVAFQLLAGCARKKERTRDDDREQIRAIIATLEKGTIQRKAELFAKVIGQSFDGAAFIDDVWLDSTDGTVSLREVRLRISPDEARVVFEVTRTRNDSTQTRKFIGLDVVYRDNRWKFIGFQDAGSQPEM